MEITNELLLSHSYFRRMKYFIKQDIPLLNSKHTFKKKVAEDFMRIKFRVFVDAFKAFIEARQYKDIGNNELINMLENLIFKGIDDYISLAKQE